MTTLNIYETFWGISFMFDRTFPHWVHGKVAELDITPPCRVDGKLNVNALGSSQNRPQNLDFEASRAQVLGLRPEMLKMSFLSPILARLLSLSLVPLSGRIDC